MFPTNTLQGLGPLFCPLKAIPDQHSSAKLMPAVHHDIHP